MKLLININKIPNSYLLLEKKTTIYELKKALKSITNEDIDIKMFINSKKELKVFDTNKYDGKTLESVWNSMKNPVVYLTTKEVSPLSEKTNFSDLPKDIKKMLLYKMDPKEALVVCKSQIGFECDWQKLLDLNYDFVTQGFAPFTTNKEKFDYLAKRVSKNIDNIPEIIFVHFNGIPLGKKRFLLNKDQMYDGNEEGDEEDEDEEDEEIEEKRNDMESIYETLLNSDSVEWVRQDDDNMWIKVRNSDNLPEEIEGKIKEEGGRRHRKIMRDNDLYDYPELRRDSVKVDYPGKVELYTEIIKKTDLIKIIKNIIIKFLKLGYGGEEGEEGEEINFDIDTFNCDLREFFLEANLENKTFEYSVYTIMQENFTRMEAELFLKPYFAKGNFADNLKKFYGFDISTMM